MFRKVALNFLSFSSKGGARVLSQKKGNWKKVSSVLIPGLSLGFLLIIKSHNFFASTEEQSPYYEVTVDANYAEGEMREVQVGPNKEDVVLVARVDGKYYCVQSTCPHFGLPLSKGKIINFQKKN